MQIFPKWANRVPLYLAASAAAAVPATIFVVWYFFSPKFTDAGYMPRQPLPFSHHLHAGELRIDCRYCHGQVERSAFASIPSTQTCTNCHKLVKRNSDKLALVRESAESGEPIHWVRVHKLPEFVYFDHSIHIRVGVGCSSCHGDIAEMDEVRQIEPLSMEWCLDCHRHPRGIARARIIDPPTDCSGCHR